MVARNRSDSRMNQKHSTREFPILCRRGMKHVCAKDSPVMKATQTFGGLYNPVGKPLSNTHFSTKFVRKMRKDLDNQKRMKGKNIKVHRSHDRNNSITIKRNKCNSKETSYVIPKRSRSENGKFHVNSITIERLTKTLTEYTKIYAEDMAKTDHDMVLCLKKLNLVRKVKKRCEYANKCLDKASNEMIERNINRIQKELTNNKTKQNNYGQKRHVFGPSVRKLNRERVNRKRAEVCPSRIKHNQWRTQNLMMENKYYSAQKGKTCQESSESDENNFGFNKCEYFPDEVPFERPQCNNYEYAYMIEEVLDAEIESATKNTRETDEKPANVTISMENKSSYESFLQRLQSRFPTPNPDVARVSERVARELKQDLEERKEEQLKRDEEKKQQKDNLSSSNIFNEKPDIIASSSSNEKDTQGNSRPTTPKDIFEGSDDSDEDQSKSKNSQNNAKTPLDSIEETKVWFDSFFEELVEFLAKAQDPNVDISRIPELNQFLNKVLDQALLKYPDYADYFEEVYLNVDQICAAISLLREETLEKINLTASNKKELPKWKERLNEIATDLDEIEIIQDLNNKIDMNLEERIKDWENDNAFTSTSTAREDEHKKTRNKSGSSSTKISGAGGDDDGSHDDSSDDDEKPKGKKGLSSRLPLSKKIKKGRSKSKRAIKKVLSSSSLSSSEDSGKIEDKEYRHILKELTKTAKNYRIKELSMHSDPVKRRERFHIWVTDLKNILSTHHKTFGLLDDYPATLMAFDDNIDRAIKAFLSSITTHMAKAIVSNSSSAYEALIDLKRNYGQTTTTDIHRENLAMMSIKQAQNEKATEFLRRVRKQMNMCKSVGCEGYDPAKNRITLINLILEGMNMKNPLYSTTISTLKDRLRLDPSMLSLVYLEEIFFDIDDKAFKTRKEGAHFIRKDFHQKNNTNPHEKSKYKNTFNRNQYQRGNNKFQKREHKVPSHIKCHICGENHYANRCPKRSNQNGFQKKVTFESAHIAKQDDEACKMALENLINGICSCCCINSNVDVSSENNLPASSVSSIEQNINDTQATTTIQEDLQILNDELSAPPSFHHMHSIIDFIDAPEITEMDSEGNDMEDPNYKPRLQNEIPEIHNLVLENDIDMSDNESIVSNNSLPDLLSRCDSSSSSDDSESEDEESEDDESQHDESLNISTSHIDADNNEHEYVHTSTTSHETNEHAFMAALRRAIDAPAIAFGHGDFAKWLLDSGATSHFTPVFSDLLQPQQLETPIHIRVADGSRMQATHQGIVELHFTSSEGTQVNLRLMRVLYVPNLQTRLFSIESFVSDGRCSALYSRGAVKLQFANDISIEISLPHIPPGTYVANDIHDLTAITGDENGFLTYIHSDGFRVNDYYIQLTPNGETDTHFIGMAQEVNNDANIVDPFQGGIDGATWKPKTWYEDRLASTNKQRMNVELGHKIFGHRAVSSLMAASHANVWDDIQMIFAGDSWCDSCKIAISPRNPMSKQSMRLYGLPLQHIFIDCIPCPGILRGLKESRDKDFYFICCPNCKYVEKINTPDKSSETVIRLLTNWRNTMIRQGFQTTLYIRTDAGTQFTSNIFKQWCIDNKITLTIAGPKHQEQNGFVESAYKTTSRMARSMLIGAKLPIQFYHFAMDYACLILRVLPAKGLINVHGKPTTTYEILHGKRPRIKRFKVFGCPVIFKRYQPQHEGDTNTSFHQLQRGSRGMFVGFPKNQAGWLIYVPEKIGGSHLIVSMDVIFDQHFLSSAPGIQRPFNGGDRERNIHGSRGRPVNITESTGDISNLTDHHMSHWGTNNVTFDSEHICRNNTTQVNNNEVETAHIDQINDENTDSDSSTHETESIEEESDNIHGSQIIDGVRRSSRLNTESGDMAINYVSAFDDIKAESVYAAFDEIEAAFTTLDKAADLLDIPISPYLPEPKSLREIKALPVEILNDWIKSVRKELKFLIENETFGNEDDKPYPDDEILPAIIVFKAKITSRGFLDKLKARCVARGDLQQKTGNPDDLWSPCVFARTFKVFVSQAVRFQRRIKQLDFVGAFCQGRMKRRLFIQLPREYASVLPEFASYFNSPRLIKKSIYGTDFAAKVWNQDLTEWLTTNTIIRFVQSEIDPSLFIYRKDNNYLFLIVYIDDSLYFGSNENIESLFETSLAKRFNLDLQGNSHWFLGTRLYREEDGSYLLDQENYIKHILNRYCGKESEWGLPRMQSTPAPVDYIFTKDNRPSEEEQQTIQKRYRGLSMASAVSSLLYAALNTRCDILWITNKLAKSSSNPGLKDFEALMHVFGYLRKYPDYAIKMYSDYKKSPVYKICTKNNIEPTNLIGFSDTSWQDCPDTGRSTCGFKVFIGGCLIDSQSTMPIPVALSSAEAEYMGACNLGAMICHLQELLYDFEFLSTDKYDANGHKTDTPSILLIDNQATVRMSKNYKVTSKNRHIGRRWHFVRRGCKEKRFVLKWIPGEDQIADDCTKTQSALKSAPHFERTLMKIPDKVKGFKSNIVGNR